MPVALSARRSVVSRLWAAGIGVGLFFATMIVGNFAIGRGRAVTRGDVGLDFLPFYCAGTLVREGKAGELYNLPAMFGREQAVARAAGMNLDGRVGGPFWNPPFYAWVFEPLAGLSFERALGVWTLVNLAALGVAIWMLVRMLPGVGWRVWGLAPVLVLVSMPMVQAVTHGQNSCVSLMLLCAVVTAWRARRAILAGAACGLMFYKPQLAVVVAVVLGIDLGWRAVASMGVVGVVLIAGSMIQLPGNSVKAEGWEARLPGVVRDSALGEYAANLPGILRRVQEEQPYSWERHPTLLAVMRMAVQGEKVGPTEFGAVVLAGMAGVLLAMGLVRGRERVQECAEMDRGGSRDRLIAATVACVPLMAPFYFDYDLLLMAVPVVLLAGERLRAREETAVDRWAVRGWVVLAGMLYINVGLSNAIGVNVAGICLLMVGTMMVIRAGRKVEIAGADENELGEAEWRRAA